ncbi:MAG: hypothetical protein L6V93_16520 [Clostridiales bacterium]|nr:MAG: hypothetical protein L6V93_16520 [Clostridiales bacterium]
MKLIYDVNDKPKFGQLLVFAFQQLLAILAATIAVPSIIGNGMSQSAALFRRRCRHNRIPFVHKIQKPRVPRLVFRVPRFNVRGFCGRRFG